MFAALGLLLVVIGAVVTFAVERDVDGIDLDALGWILMAAGVASLIAGLVYSASWWTRRPMHSHYERHVTPAGDYVEDSQIG